MQLLRMHIPENVPRLIFHDVCWGAAWSWRVMQSMLLLKIWGPVTGLCSRRNVQMGVVQVMYTWIFLLVVVCRSLPARILHCWKKPWNCITCKYRHGLVVRLGDCNHSNLGSNPKGFLPKNLHFWHIIITSLLLQYYSLLPFLWLPINAFCDVFAKCRDGCVDLRLTPGFGPGLQAVTRLVRQCDVLPA